MSEFTERVRSEALSRVADIDIALTELSAERDQLAAIVQAIDTHNDKITRLQSEERDQIAAAVEHDDDDLAERHPVLAAVAELAGTPEGELLVEDELPVPVEEDDEPAWPAPGRPDKSELELEDSEGDTPEPISDSGEGGEPDTATPDEPGPGEVDGDEPDAAGDTITEPPAAASRGNGGAKASSARGAAIRAENEKAVRDAAQSFGRPFNRRELGERLGMSPHSSSITKALRALVERGTLIRTGGQAGPNVRYEWEKPDPH